MSRKKTGKAYWEMTTEELRHATKEFDEEFVADQAKALTPEMKAQWERARSKLTVADNGKSEETIAIRLDKSLLKQCRALAKKRRLTCDALVARGLRALLAAEGE